MPSCLAVLIRVSDRHENAILIATPERVPIPREIVAYAVWVYHRFVLSTADVEELLAERGVVISRETVRQWVNRFGRHFADCIRCNRPGAVGKWHLDEGALPIDGRKYWLWRMVEAKGMSSTFLSSHSGTPGRHGGF